MTDYKTIRGKKIKSFATDLGNEQAEGQIFYSNTDNQFKTAVSSSAWSSSGPLITGRRGFWGTGTQTAGLAFGGKDGPGAGTAVTNATEEYNGNGWSAGGNLGTARYVLGGATNAPQTASLGFGGYGPLTNSTEEYDGSSWTSGGNLNTARGFLAGAGTQTSALGFGGYTSGDVNNSEEYNGTSWTEGNNLAQTIRQMAGNGLQTAALSVGGLTGGGTARDITEEYNGTSWSSGGTMASAHFSLRSVGTQDDALAFGGSPPPSKSTQTQAYDGSSWSSKPTMATARNGSSCSGTSTAAITAGGLTGAPSTITSTSEEFNVTVNTITAAAWSSGGNLGTARSRGTGGGTLTAGICVNGITVDVEEYNGTSWSEQNNMPTALRDPCGFGTQTAFVGCAGYQPGGSPVNTGSTYEYDGSNWTSGGTMNVGRDGTSLHFGGVLTAGLVNGGGTPPYKQTEEYNGTSWSNANASSLDHYRTNITGTQTAAFIFGGYGIDPGGPQAGASVTFTEEYDGTNFSSGDSLLTGANAPLGMSNSNKDDSTCAGGFDQATSARLSLTQNYNGTVWATGASLGTARYAGTGGGSAAGGFVASGNVPPTTNATEELTAETTSLNLKTITDS